MSYCVYRTPCGICDAMMTVTGHVHHVSEKIDCDIVCPKKGILTEAFVQWTIERAVSGNQFRLSAVKKHIGATPIVPVELPAIKDAYGHLGKVYVTGSAVLQTERPIKDIDIVVIVEDAFDLCGLQYPKKLNGVPVDVFFKTKLNRAYAHVSLDGELIPALEEPDDPIGKEILKRAKTLTEDAPPRFVPDNFVAKGKKGCCE